MVRKALLRRRVKIVVLLTLVLLGGGIPGCWFLWRASAIKSIDAIEAKRRAEIDAELGAIAERPRPTLTSLRAITEAPGEARADDAAPLYMEELRALHGTSASAY